MCRAVAKGASNRAVWACSLIVVVGCTMQPTPPSASVGSATLPPAETEVPAPSGRGPCATTDLTSPAPSGAVLVFFTCGSSPTRAVVPVRRESSPEAVDDRLATAIKGLLAGPTAEEEADGLRSWFSSQTADRLNGVSVDGAGHAIVQFADFSDAIPNASTAGGRLQLLAELRSTILQFDEIETAEVWFDGSCQAFWGWLQTTCTVLRRDDG